MPALNRISKLWRLSPLAAGQAAPALSLTAEEGTWIKIRDFQGHLNVVLVFFRSLGMTPPKTPSGSSTPSPAPSSSWTPSSSASPTTAQTTCGTSALAWA